MSKAATAIKQRAEARRRGLCTRCGSPAGEELTCAWCHEDSLWRSRIRNAHNQLERCEDPDLHALAVMKLAIMEKRYAAFHTEKGRLPPTRSRKRS